VGQKNRLNWSGFWFQGKTRLCGLSQSLLRLLCKIHCLCTDTWFSFLSDLFTSNPVSPFLCAVLGPPVFFFVLICNTNTY
jgi:hypothetical protein